MNTTPQALEANASASSPGKIILFGEHAVVYDKPAVAAPVTSLQTQVTISPRTGKAASQSLVSLDIQPHPSHTSKIDHNPVISLINRSLINFNAASRLPLHVYIASSIPIGRGFGSSASVFTAVVKSLARYLNHTVSPAQVASAAFDADHSVHGNASGIDVTVCAYAQCLSYCRGAEPDILTVPRGFTVAIADTGSPGFTRKAVSRVRQKYTNEPTACGRIINDIGAVSTAACAAIQQGEPALLGPLMDKNHELLQKLGVSTSRLDHLVVMARKNGAIGAKLSGAGLGGNTISLVTDRTKYRVRDALIRAGATSVIFTQVKPSP